MIQMVASDLLMVEQYPWHPRLCMPEKQVLAIEVAFQKHAVNLILQNYMWTNYAALGLSAKPRGQASFCY